MSQSVSFSILGLDGITLKMQGLRYDARYRGGRFALRKAAKVLAQHVRNNSLNIDDPLTDRSIPANVDIRWNRRLFEDRGVLGFRVGIMGGAGGKRPTQYYEGNPGGDTRYWRHIEFGTVRSRAQPFMRRALSDNINEITNVFVTEFGEALTRALRRAGKN